MIVVDPPLTRYTISRGSEAIVGKNNLCRHLKSRTSSANPRNIIQHIDNWAHINCVNYNINTHIGIKFLLEII